MTHRAVTIAAVLACLAAFVSLSWWELRDESPTYDEGPHLSAAYTALVLGDFRLVTEQPPLGRRVGALPLLAERVRLPAPGVAWATADHFEYGYRFLFQSGNDADRLLLRARLAMLGWGVLLLLTIFAVARHVFGTGGGLVALATATFNPNLLAHAHLITTDVPAAAMALLAVAAFQLWLDRPGLVRAAAAGILAGGAVATKFSLLPLGGVFAIMTAVSAWRRLRDPAQRQGGAGRAAGRRALELALVAASAYLVVWGAYDFRYTTSPDREYDPLHHLRFGSSMLTPALRWIGDRRLLPEALLVGLTELRYHAAVGHPGFALGQFSMTGWWWYLPLAFVVKNPVCWQVLIIAGGWMWWRGRAGHAPWGVGVIAAAAVLTGVALMSPLAMGIRHLFPAVPFAFVATGGAVALLRAASPPWCRVVTALLLLGVGAECLAESPYHLTYFNAPTVALTPRERVLTDSNLDWGQDLKRLKRYMDAHGIASVKLAYFGMASPGQLGLRNEVLETGLGLYPKLEPLWKRAARIEPGDYVALSAFCVFARAELVQAVASHSDPVASIGRSLLLFRARDAFTVPPSNGR